MSDIYYRHAGKQFKADGTDLVLGCFFVAGAVLFELKIRMHCGILYFE